MARYLDAVKACVTEEEFAKTKKKADKFLSDAALVSELESFLGKRREATENWAYEYWLSDMYMNNPIALPVNSNPGWVLPKKDFSASGGDKERCLYVARFASKLLGCKESFEKGTLDQDYAASRSGPKQPLCMEQYFRVFNTYRHPGAEGDHQEVVDGRTARDREHVVVMRKCHLFTVEVKSGGRWIEVDTLASILLHIQDLTLPTVALDERVPVLTAASRDRWAQHRDALRKADSASAALAALESCLFLICLDERTQNSTDAERSQKSAFLQMLCGGGPHSNGANRWYDKTIQLVSSPDGVLGVCYEHSVAEGIAVVAMVTKVAQELDKEERREDFVKVDESCWKFKVEELKFPVSEEVKGRVAEAAEDFKFLSDDTDVEVFVFSDFGKGFMKASKCSPDGFVQMALQLAYFRLHGCLCFSYESASTRRFRCGRVDNIRSSHPEALEWVRSMTGEGTAGKEERRSKFRSAMTKQAKMIAENINGTGLDIPLLGIREACKELRPNEKCDLFKDKVYLKSQQFQLSTSQVPIALPYSYMGYGAVVPDGYGVSYNLQESDIIFCVASFFSAPETSSLEMTESVGQSLKLMREMLQD